MSKEAVQLWVKQGYVPNARIKDIEKIYGIEPQRLCNPKLLELMSKIDDSED